MARFTVGIETTKRGTFLVRGGTGRGVGERKTFYQIEPFQEAIIDGETLRGRKLAKKLAEQTKQQFYKNSLGGSDPLLEIAPQVEAFLSEREANNLSPKTLAHNRESLIPFMAQVDAKVIGEISREKILAWKVQMGKEGLSLNTVSGRLADVRTFLNWLVAAGKLSISPFGKKMMPEKKDPEPKYYTVAEFMALDVALVKIGDHAVRLGINLAHSAGLRKIEFVGNEAGTRRGVLYEDITWYPNGEADLLVRKEVAKGGKRSRVVALDPALIALLGSRRTGPIVQCTRYHVDDMFQKARKMAGINKDLDIHGLRHTFAKNFLQSGKGSLPALQKAMGHSTLASTEIYSQFEKSHFQEVAKHMYERRMQEEALVEKLRVVA